MDKILLFIILTLTIVSSYAATTAECIESRMPLSNPSSNIRRSFDEENNRSCWELFLRTLCCCCYYESEDAPTNSQRQEQLYNFLWGGSSYYPS